MAQQRKETGYCKSLVAIPQDLEVDRMLVEVVGEEGNGRVDGDHEQYTDDVPLLPWFEVVSAMPPNEVP